MSPLTLMPRFRSSKPAAFLTWTDFAQVPPGINAEIVIIVPCEPDGVFADRFRGKRFGRGLEHGQHTGSQSSRLARLAVGFVALFVAHGARAVIAEIDEAVVRNVTVFPLNVHASSSSEIYLYRPGICGRSGRLKRGLHELQYRIGECSGEPMLSLG